MIGETLNQYRITATIGAGGMGEVFRARDTRLNRDVAIKVLPKDFVADADRMRRFEQEAKTLAALNHPNVLTIHDAGVHEGAPYLVSELLEGKTLREEMNGAALPLRKATEYALQIAHGLAAAHGKGVIHRDLKPENIFVTKDGRVKILDFGLAKLRTNQKAQIGNQKAGEAATIRIDADAIINTTEPGMVMGTPAYMSPEQVRGEPTDHRADIFAFGAVLYEMLSGTQAFRRKTPVESMHAVLNETLPELSTTHPNIPTALADIVERCLEKQPDNRFQSSKDLAFALNLKNLETPLAAHRAETSRKKQAADLASSSGGRSGAWKIAVPVGAIAVLALLVYWHPWKNAVSMAPAKGSVTDPAHHPLSRAREVCIKGADASRDEMKLALTFCQSVMDRDPANAEAWALSARLNGLLYEHYERTPERLDAAQAAAKNALSLAPASVTAQLAHAIVLTLQKATYSQSLEILRRLERESPNDPDVLVTLGGAALFEDRKTTSAVDVLPILDRALALRPDDPMARTYKAWALTFAGRTAEAEVVWNEAIDRMGSSSAMLGKFYDLAMTRGKSEEAKVLLTRFPSDLVFNDLAARLVTHFWLSQREPTKALAFIQSFPREFLEDRFLQIPKGYLVGKAHEQAGQLAAAKLEWRKGLDAVNRRLAAQPGNPRVIFFKACLHFLLGEPEEADRQAEIHQQLTTLDDPELIFTERLALQMEFGRVQNAVSVIKNYRKAIGSSARGAVALRSRLKRYAAFYPRVGSAPEFQSELANVEAELARMENSQSVNGQTGVAMTTAETNKSIAVLAFANMSAEKDNEYFSDGITEEILNALARTPGLRVAARTSAFSFKGKNESVQRIGEALKVGVLLEGSVRRAGKQLLITARLINVADDSILWSEKFERNAEDLFAIQTEVAQRVLEVLKVKLLVGSRPNETLAGTSNLEAYDLYLRGRELWNRRTGPELQRAVGLFQQATEKDPKFAAAYAGLASCYAVLFEYASLPMRETNPKARAAALRALELDSRLAEAHAVLGSCLSNDWDLDGAEQEYQQALRLNPNHATTRHWYSLILIDRGRKEEALTEIRRAQALDPLSAPIQSIVAHLLFFAGRYDEALAETEKALKLSPDFPIALRDRGSIFLMQNKLPEAIAEFEKMRAKTIGTPYALGALGNAYGRGGRTNEARQILEQLKTSAASGSAVSYDIATVHLGLGEIDQAFPWFERAVESRDWDPRSWKIDPLMAKVVKDPRYAVLLKRFGLDK